MTDRHRQGQRHVVLVTGGSQGIGAGIVDGYRKRGWSVVSVARHVAPSETSDLLNLQGDISDPETSDRVIGATIGRFGRIDTLVNDAGVYIEKPFIDYTAEDYATVVGVNLTGFFMLTQRAITEMLKAGRGHVVNISTTLVDFANSKIPSVLGVPDQGRGRRGHTVIGDRACLAGDPGQRRLARCDRDAHEPAGVLRRPGPASSARPCGQRRRRGAGHSLPRVVSLRHRRDPPHRRWADRRSLTATPRPLARLPRPQGTDQGPPLARMFGPSGIMTRHDRSSWRRLVKGAHGDVVVMAMAL